MRLHAFFSVLLIFPIPLIAQNRDTTLKELYDSHRWFELRQEVTKPGVPLFFKAAVEAAFALPGAEKGLQAVEASDNSAKFEARELLMGAYFRKGQYKEAWSEGERMLHDQPNASDVANLMPTLEILKAYPDQTVTERRPKLTAITIEDGNVFVPLKINQKSANYILDNGFSVSAISESEVKRLGLRVVESATQVDTMNGTGVKVRIAVVRDLTLGGVRLKNVAFYVIADTQPPFDSLAKGRQGILGLPVLIALERFWWSPASRTFCVCGDGSSGIPGPPNLAFDGTSVFVQVFFRGTGLEFSLDTGAQDTEMYPGFLHAFPGLQREGTEETHKVTGVGGSSQIDSLRFRSLEFQVGGKAVVLQPAHVLLQSNNSTSSWFAGNLGMDLLNQGQTIAVDFQAMRLLLK